MELPFRQFQASDSAALSQIIRETWRYDTFCPPSTASRLAKAYLYGCLAHQTYTQVALIHDVPVGIIMVNDQRKRRSPLSFRLKQSFLILSLLCSQKGRAAFRLLWEAEKVDQELLRRCSPYDGELSFFAVSRRCRGAGIGKLLFDQAMTYMRREGFSSFYLFTDTSCNYSFYEHQGMQRRAEKSCSVKMGEQRKDFTLYLYDSRL